MQSDEVQKLMSLGAIVRRPIARNTHRAYVDDEKYLTRWCAAHGSSVVPMSIEKVIECIMDMRQSGYATETIIRRIHTLGTLHNDRGCEDPGDDKGVRRLILGIERDDRRATGVKTCARTEDLFPVRERVPARLSEWRDRALVLLLFASGLYRRDMALLDMKHLSFLEDGQLAVRIPNTDRDVLVSDQHVLRPVAAIRRWLEVSEIKFGPVFPRIRKDGLLLGRMTGESVNTIVKKQTNVTSRALRVGTILDMKDDGATDLEVQRQTGRPAKRIISKYVERFGRR